MRYRDHRGSLSASLETEQKINSLDELKLHLNSSLAFFNFEVEEIKFEYCGFDERIGWNTYYVLQKIKGKKGFTVAGMSDSNVWEANENKAL